VSTLGAVELLCFGLHFPSVRYYCLEKQLWQQAFVAVFSLSYKTTYIRSGFFGAGVGIGIWDLCGLAVHSYDMAMDEREQRHRAEGDGDDESR
jgi:hypothetical protein